MTIAPEVIQKINWIGAARAAGQGIRYAGRLGRNINDAHRAARRVATFASAARRVANRVSSQVGVGYRAGRSGIREGTTLGARIGRQLGRASRAPGSVGSFGAGTYAGLRGGESAFNRARDVGITGAYLRGARAGVTVRNVPGIPARNIGSRAKIHRYIRTERGELLRELDAGKVSITAARQRSANLNAMESAAMTGAFRDRATRARTLLDQRLVSKPSSGQRVWQSGYFERDGTWNNARWRRIPGT